MNNVVLIGRLARDPELRFVPGSGMAVANFTMAIDKGLTREKKQEFERQGKPTADFIRIVVWGKQAENCGQYLEKGKLVGIQGSIQTSSFKQPNGEVRYTTEILASRVEFLEFGMKIDGKSVQFEPEKNNFDFGARAFDDFQSIEDDDDVPF